MSFQAYLDNVQAKAGKSAEQLQAEAIEKGLADANGLAPDVKPAQIIDWLKTDYGLGHGHAMSVVAYLKGKRG